jgi:hypothetical protein
MFHRVIRAATLGAVLVLVCAGAALAASPHSAGTETTTEHARNEVFFSEESVNPCTGEAGTLTAIAKNGVFHATTQADGDFWITGTFTGIVTFTPTEADGTSASGHFTVWFGAAQNNKNTVEHETGTFHLTGSDGSRITIKSTGHMSTNANGEVTASFEKPRLTCG